MRTTNTFYNLVYPFYLQEGARRMSCFSTPPRIVGRDAADIRAALAGNRRGYVPEWSAGAGAGMALNAALARNLEIQGDGLNAMPLRLQLAFLDSIGANVLPAQPARAPLVFTLLDTAAADAAVPAGCRVGAVLPPPAPSLDGSTDAPPPTAPEFFTEQEIMAMRGSLAAVYSIDPQADTYADHSGRTPGDFAVIRIEPAGTASPLPGACGTVQSHGHGRYRADVQLWCGATDGAPGAGQRPLLLDWEYLSADGWLPLELVEDGTARFTQDGKITLRKVLGPDSKNDVVDGIIKLLDSGYGFGSYAGGAHPARCREPSMPRACSQ